MRGKRYADNVVTKEEFVAALVQQGWGERLALIDWNRLRREGWEIPEPGVETLNGGLKAVRLQNSRG